MTHERERRIKQTLINLLEIFQNEEESLSQDTEEGIVQALEGLRWDYHRLIPDSPVWEELEGRLRRLDQRQKKRFEHLVREMLLRQSPEV